MRDYEKEAKDQAGRKYAYDTDYILRRYMMRAFSPYMQNGRALELGCYEGEFTRLIASIFDDITVVEAAASLVESARSKVPSAKFVVSTFEAWEPQDAYDTVFLIHTLEHLDDPVAVLSRIHGWLQPEGRLFIAVPNANAASRQIAVKMGLIPYNAAITAGEREHGHRATYSLDTLEWTARQAGLTILNRGGVLFKALANFQLDAALQANIIDEAYFDGCYELGMHYPDLCASVYLVCARGSQSGSGSNPTERLP